MNTDGFVKKTTFEEGDVGIFWIFVNSLYIFWQYYSTKLLGRFSRSSCKHGQDVFEVYK